MEDVNHSIDDRRAIRQQAELAETSTVMLMIMRPLFQQQRALIRFWADMSEAMVLNAERIAETVSSLTQQQTQQHLQQHLQQTQQTSPTKR